MHEAADQKRVRKRAEPDARAEQPGGEEDGDADGDVRFAERERGLAGDPLVQHVPGREPEPRFEQGDDACGEEKEPGDEPGKARWQVALDPRRRTHAPTVPCASGPDRLLFSMEAISDSFRWAGVELRHLVTLRTVADEGSLAGAARRLGYSQPAVSQQLATLERLVGARLVERRPGAREVALTPAGRRVLLHGEAMLARAQAADAELRGLERGTVGTLRLGTIPSVGARVVPLVLSRFALAWPDVAIELVEAGDDRRLLAQVEAAELDFAFAGSPVDGSALQSLVLLEDPYVLFVAADSPLAGSKRKVGLSRLAKLPLIVCDQSLAPEALLRSHGIDAQIRYRVDDNATLAGLVAAGLGAGLVPRLAIDGGRPDLVELELAV